MGNGWTVILISLSRFAKRMREAGAKKRVELQHKLGKLTARERIDLLADPGTFEELGSVVREFNPPGDGEGRPSPADGVVMGLARVKGRQVTVYSLDFTVMSGAIGDQGVWKIAELIRMAGRGARFQSLGF